MHQVLGLELNRTCCTIRTGPTFLLCCLKTDAAFSELINMLLKNVVRMITSETWHENLGTDDVDWRCFSWCEICCQSWSPCKECSRSNLNCYCKAVTVNLTRELFKLLKCCPEVLHLYITVKKWLLLMLLHFRSCWLSVCVTPLEQCSSVSPSAAPFLAAWSRMALGSSHKYGTRPLTLVSCMLRNIDDAWVWVF